MQQFVFLDINLIDEQEHTVLGQSSICLGYELLLLDLKWMSLLDSAFSILPYKSFGNL